MGVVGQSRQKEDGLHAAAVADLRPTVERAVRLIAGAGSAHAEDAVQEALIAIDRDLGQVRDPAAARAWAHRVATRCALKMARRERRRALIGLAPPPPPRAVEGIDPTLGAIIEAFGCAPGTVKSQLFEARKRLAAELSDEERP